MRALSALFLFAWSFFFFVGVAFVWAASEDHLVQERFRHPFFKEDRVSYHLLRSRPGVGLENDSTGYFLGRKPSGGQGRIKIKEPQEKLMRGGIWIEVVDKPGSAFYFRYDEALPALSVLGPVRFYHTAQFLDYGKRAESFQLRFVRELNFSGLPLDVDEIPNIQMLVEELHKKSLLDQEDYLQVNMAPRGEGLDRPYLYLKTRSHRELPKFRGLWPPDKMEDQVKNDPQKIKGYWLENSDKPGVLIFYPLDEPLPEPELEHYEIAIYDRDSFALPLFRLRTESYPKAATLRSLESLIRSSQKRGKTALLSAPLERVGFELQPLKNTNERAFAKFSQSDRTLTYHLPADRMIQIQQAGREHETDWDAYLGHGYWVSLPEVDDRFHWFKLDDEFKLPSEVKVEVLRFLVPRVDRWVGKLSDLKAKIDVARESSKQTGAFTLREILVAVPEAQRCPDLISQIPKIVGSKKPPDGMYP